MKSLVLFLTLSSCFASAASRAWTPDDLILAEHVESVAVAPDGARVVWVKGQMNKEKGTAMSNLILRDLGNSHEIELTRGMDNNTAPAFSPEGGHIAFLSDRKSVSAKSSGSKEEDQEKSEDEHKTQIWLFDSDGGEPSQLTSLENGVRGFAWADAGTIIFYAQEDPSYFAQTKKRRKDTTNPVDDEKHEPAVRLFKLDLKTKPIRRISRNSDRIQSLAVSDDGHWAVVTAERSLHYIYDQKIKPATYLYDLVNDKATELFRDGKLLPAHVQWSRDGKGFYFVAPYTRDPSFVNASVGRLYFHSLSDEKTTEVLTGWNRGIDLFTVIPNGVVALLPDGVRPKVAAFVGDGSGLKRTFISDQPNLNVFGLWSSRNGRRLVLNESNASTPTQLYAATLNLPDASVRLTSRTRITDLNPSYKQLKIARSEVVHWKGAKEDEVEGLLFYPHNYQAGRRYPLVLMIHGRPFGADHDEWDDSFFYPRNMMCERNMCERNAFVLLPNYHGSSDYGLDWAESTSHGQYNELEWKDADMGVDAMIARGLVDPEKLGVMGWSNGSINTIELTVRTNRYKVASAGAGDVNWTSDWGNAVFGEAFDHYYLGNTPLDDPAYHVKKSPLFQMSKVTTPTIIFFGTIDRQVPTEQGWQHYRALQYYGKAPTKFFLFPGEPHGPKQYVHQRRKLVEELRWFDQYLFQTRKDENESLNPDSPLAAVLARGKMGDVPEVARMGTLQIGRFEVTRKQYSRFDSNYHYAPGTDDYPANSITFENAKRYCQWLTERTGKPVEDRC
jgi:dipeptidyl aminopeptidase/acylaminoacyl peptidase